MTTIGQALVAGLAARGVEVVFGIPGVHTIELYRGLEGSGIRHVTARHEQGAGFMADGYARVTGRPGVAFVITGPGLTNALTAMAQARADSVPMLVVSGAIRRGAEGRGLGLLHELPDQQGLIARLCPSFRVERASDVVPMLDAAFAAMTAGRPGPAHIEVPVDVMGLRSDMPGRETIRLVPAPPAAPAPVYGGYGRPGPRQRSRTLATMTEAARPVIIAGGGARRAGASLCALAEAWDAPVVQTVNARGLMHGHGLTVAASPSLGPVRDLLRGADVVLAVGTEFGQTDFDMYATGDPPDYARLVRVDIDPEQVVRHPCAMTVQGDAARVLADMLPEIAPRQGDGVARAATTRAAARAGLSSAMQAQVAMLEAVRDAAPAAIVVGDSTQPVYAGNLCFDAPFPGAWFNAATGYGALGYAPGAAIGAAVAAPGVPVICLVGDGGVQFAAAELATARDEGLPVTFLVWNNGGYREIAEAMAAAGVVPIGCAPSALDHAALARACRLGFARLDASDLEGLRAALAAPAILPRLIELVVGGR